uniref:aldo/keto reductase n=1 Tax=Eggerthella sinensis TaxID=242230 RepID=UPI0022E50752
DEAVAAVASRHDATPAQVLLAFVRAQVLLAFVIRSGTVVAIPKASTPAHARDNAAALELRLTDDDLALLDQRFPAPDRKMPLDME